MERNYSISAYNASTMQGETLVERNVLDSYTAWKLRVLYNGKNGNVWSQASQSFSANVSGNLMIIALVLSRDTDFYNYVITFSLF